MRGFDERVGTSFADDMRTCPNEKRDDGVREAFLARWTYGFAHFGDR